MGKIFAQTRKFLELTKDLKKSYENGILEEQREFIQLVTSNLKVEGRKLTIAMRSPFLELSQRHVLNFGEHNQDTPRIENPTITYSDINTSPIIGKPLSEEKLKVLLDVIISQVAQLPESNEETNYGI